MPNLTLFFGTCLVLVGVIGYFATGRASITALIPAFVGLLLVVFGALARSPGRRKHMMHAAAAVGLLGFLAAAGRLMGALMRDADPKLSTVTSLALMAMLCGIFVVLCVASFVSARRRPPEETAGLRSAPRE